MRSIIRQVYRFSNLNKPEVVSLQQAETQIKQYCQMENQTILQLALLGDQDAREERLIREIMSVEQCSWLDAQPRFNEMLTENRKYQFYINLPYNIGIIGALLLGFGSFPMIFEYNTVYAFNQFYVTSDVPDQKDLETMYEVGNWSWNWMEPPLGVLSFFILCMQYARNQLQNLNRKPYTGWIKQRRSQRLIKQYPQYNKLIIESWSIGDSFSAKKNQNNIL